jgi:DNA-binding PadR family transcriptional regulator
MQKELQLTTTTYWNKLIKGAFTKFLIVYALRQSPSYAYQISLFVEELTQGIISPTEGTLYPTLSELEAGKYVTSKTEEVEGRQRKIYRLTRRGHQAYYSAFRTLKETLSFLTRITE